MLLQCYLHLVVLVALQWIGGGGGGVFFTTNSFIVSDGEVVGFRLVILLHLDAVTLPFLYKNQSDS